MCLDVRTEISIKLFKIRLECVSIAGELGSFLEIFWYVAWNHTSLSSVQFSRSVMSNSLWPHGLQHARLPCPSPALKAYSDSRPLSQWCHPTISSSVVPFSSCLQSFLASGSFPMSQLFTSGGQSVRVSASASVLPMNMQDWFPLKKSSVHSW